MLLGDIATIQVGMIVKRNIEDDNLETFKVVTGKCFTSSNLSKDFETGEFNRKEVEKFILKKGDIIIKSVEPFEVLYVREDDVVFTNLVFKIGGIKVSNTDILAILTSQDFKNYLSKNVIGTSIQRINIQILRDYKIKEIDSRMNEMKFEIRKLIDLKEEEIKEYKKYLFVDKKREK